MLCDASNAACNHMNEFAVINPTASGDVVNISPVFLTGDWNWKVEIEKISSKDYFFRKIVVTFM